jgi:hypothetical protein
MKHTVIVRWCLFGICLGLFGAHCVFIGSAIAQRKIGDTVFFGVLSLIWLYLVLDMMRRAMSFMPTDVKNYWNS